MISSRKLIILLSLLFTCITTIAQVGKDRFALIIGVKNYLHIAPLKNTLNDAQDMAAMLKSKGFHVIEILDPKTKREMQDGIVKYFRLLEMNKDASGIVYYSGHGMQVDGSNYLIPAAANPEIKADLEDQCLNMDYVMNAIAEANNPLNIFILDACRNNPFKGFSRSGEKGLSMVATPKSSYIVYATKPGSVASDGDGRNGLFTSKLLKFIDEKGLNIEQMFKRVAAAVVAESNNTQRPWIASDYSGDFFFTPRLANSNITYSAETVFTDDFSDNRNKWFEEERDNFLFKISGGKYSIQSKKGGYWFTYIPIQLNTNSDFEISATFTKVGGTDDYYYGLLLGINPVNNYSHLLGITGSGNFAFANKGPAPQDHFPAKIYDAVQKGNSTNHLSIKKLGSLYKLYVNGKFIGDTAFEPFFGNNFGFQLWSGDTKLSIEVNDLEIRYLN